MELLLNKQALKGLSEEDQAAVKDQALGQFLLGSIFGGQGIASGYQAVQNIIPSLQQQRQQQGLLKEVASIQEKYFPNEQQETRQALNTNLGRDRLASNPYSLTTSLGLPQENIQAQGRNQPIDFNAALKDVARLSTNPNATKMLPGITEAFKNLQPTVQAGGLITDPNRNVTGGLPQYDAQRGLVSSPTVRGGNVDFNITAAPGYAKAVESNLTYQPQPGEVPLYDKAGYLRGVGPMLGSVENLLARERAKAEGGAFGIPESVFNPLTQRKEFRSRADVLGLNTTPTTGGAPRLGGTNKGGAAGGFAAEPSASEKTLTETADLRYKAFSKTSQDAADTSGGRKLAAQQLYDLSTRIDNNKLTGIQAGVYGYMNAIPGVGKFFEQDITDVTRMNQAIATAQLEKTAQQKGAASNLDQQVIARGYATLTDPATATRMLAAQELALADKDIARNQFVEAYKGDPAKIGTAWDKSPENQPIFEHPKFKQFLNEQISKNPSAPVLPAGFTLVQGKSGKYGVKRPDGTVMPVGQ
jgi:hypothetical protein